MAGIEDLLRRRREMLEEIDAEIQGAWSRAVTLMFTDIVGSTEYYERHGDIAGRQMVQTHNDLLFPVIAEAGGRVIKTIGDSIMASFEDPRAAVGCAVRMQERLRDHNRDRSAREQIRVRMGLHFGRAVADDRDLFGDVVNTAARVESLADGGQVLISGELAEQLSGSGPGLVELGSDKVKGRQQPVTFYLVNWEGLDPGAVREAWQRRKPGRSAPAAVPATPPAGAQAPAGRPSVEIRGTPDPAAEAARVPPPSNRGNPYLNRVMLPHPDLFFGRETLLRRLFRRLEAERPQSVSVVGERRIGKSSLLNTVRSPHVRLAHLASPERFFFVMIDFQQFRSLDETGFYGAVFSEVQKQSAGVLRLDLEPSQAGLSRLCETLTERGFRLVLLFDEFECVTKNERFGAPFYSLLRSLANNTALAFVTASARPLKDMCVTHQIADSPFFNIFAAQYLALFAEKEARALIGTPSQARGIPLAPLADDILEMGGLYPFFLQMACSAWFDFLELEGAAAAEHAGKPAPREVLEAFREEATPHFEYVLETLPDDERAALLAGVRGGVAAETAEESLERKGYLAGRVPFSTEFRRFLERLR